MNGKERKGGMTAREVMPHLPTSGQIIGALVAGLGVKHPVLQSRKARRYFSARPDALVKESTREEIIEAIGEVLTDYGFISSPLVSDDNYDLVAALASMLKWHADNWDLMRSFLRRRTVQVSPIHLPKIWEAYIRLAVIDLALRVAAHLHLSGTSPIALELLGWANRKGRGDFLNEKRRQSGLPLEDLAEAVGVHDNTVDAWMYHGARPLHDNLGQIARVLAGNIKDSKASGIALQLRLLYWISDVGELLAEHIGDDAVGEAIGRLRQYAEATYHIIEEQFPSEDRAANLAVLADLGVGARLASAVLTALAELEPDEEWREDLGSTGVRWVRRVLSANLNVHLAEVDDLIQTTEGRLLKDWDVGPPEAYAHYRRSQELQMQGKLHEALAEVEIAARLDPLDPANHFTLGSVKTGIGIGRGDAALVREGLDALWLAVALDSKWIVPWTEIGSTLLHTGRPEETVAHLRSVKPDCGPLDAHYYRTLGSAYWKLDRLSEALAAFEKAIELDPEETSALVAASEIALWSGDKEKHRRYHRMAHHYGAEEDTDALMEFLRQFRQEEPGKAGSGSYQRKIAIGDAVIRLNPEDADAYLARGLAHFENGKEDLAVADLDSFLRLNPDHGGIYHLRGTLHARIGRWDRVTADMTEAIRLDPEDGTAYYDRGLAHGEMDALDLALADLSEAIRLDHQHSDAYRARGDCHRYKGEYSEAIADFDTALRLDPENAAAHLGRGAAYRMKGDLDEAIMDYSAAIKIEPEDHLAHRFRGDAHLAKGDYDLAIHDFTSALKLSPDDSVAYRSRGDANLFKEQFETALQDFEAAVKADPKSGIAVYARGLTRQVLGDASGAEEDFRLARELGYDDQDP